MKEISVGPKKMWALRLPDADLDKLSQCADASGTTKTDVIRQLINQYYEEHVAERVKAAHAKARKQNRKNSGR